MRSGQEYDIKLHLQAKLPEFFLLLGNNTIRWNRVNSAYAQKISRYFQRFERTGATFPIEASLYHIITLSEEGNPDALRNLKYIKLLLVQLREILIDTERKEIVPALYGLLTNIDQNFRNFLGELSVLNMLKLREPVTLLKTERPLFKAEPKGIKIDFHFLNRETRKDLLVEIVNIHLDDENTGSNGNIERLLDEKIKGKLLVTGIQRSRNFTLVPVLWGDWPLILRMLAYYQTVRPIFQNTIIPSCLIPFTTVDDMDIFYFGTINTIFTHPGGVKFSGA